jgi:hypothetical protein
MTGAGLARLIGAALAIASLPVAPLEGQEPPTAPGHVRWGAIDLVLVPDSCYGIWLLAAPNLAFQDRSERSRMIRFPVEPVTLLQWAGTARALAHAPVSVESSDEPRFRTTPRLQNRADGRFILLARSTKLAPTDQRLQLVAVDSVNDTRWKTFASTEDVDRLASVIEELVPHLPPRRPPTDSTLVDEDRGPGLEPVAVLKIPSPRYPPELWRKHRTGRVWTQYVVGTDGRMEQGSFRAVLTDDPQFAEAALRALEGASYRPASLHGVPVRQRVFQVLSFRLSP